jgi:hypothetical protein
MRGDILEALCVKKNSRIVRQEIAVILLVTCHLSAAFVCGSLARHFSAFSGLFQAS